MCRHYKVEGIPSCLLLENKNAGAVIDLQGMVPYLQGPQSPVGNPKNVDPLLIGWRTKVYGKNRLDLGQKVKIFFLKGAANLNWLEGVVVGYQDVNRYLVEIDMVLGGKETKALKRSNLMPMGFYDDETGGEIVAPVDESRKAYRVSVKDSKEEQEVSATDVRYDADTPVVLRDLEKAAHLNGSPGFVQDFDGERYAVVMNGAEILKMKPEKVYL